jgi:hypothetical protein
LKKILDEAEFQPTPQQKLIFIESKGSNSQQAVLPLPLLRALEVDLSQLLQKPWSFCLANRQQTEAY